MQPPKAFRQLPVRRHRVRDPRGADHTRVCGDEQDRRREDADVDLRGVENASVQSEILHEPEHRIVREPMLVGGLAEQCLEAAARSMHG